MSADPDPWARQEGGADLTALAGQLCAGLLRLAASEDACRLLGVEGTLEDEVDIAFAIDPVSWIGSEIANALRESMDQADSPESEDEAAESAPSLSLTVALIRLAGILRGGPLTADELAEAVVDFLADE